MKSRALDEWLTYLEGLHPSEIDLGLDRVGRVAESLGIAVPSARVITVAGTNGKGSVCALLQALLEASGYRVGCYTSPHLVRFNERIRIDGADARDDEICAAFERVEAGRDGISLTFFEFGTLAAFDLFKRSGVDVWILEVGLGGRLDATNVVDADVSVVTSVGIDHVEWLGEDRDAVGREKAGIARRGRPLVVGDRTPPRGLIEAAADVGAGVIRIGEAFDCTVAVDRWDWLGPNVGHADLPLPALAGGYQVRNAATALAAIHWCGIACERAAIEHALHTVRIPGRFQVLRGETETILDVAHNPDAAAALATALRERACNGRTLAVIAMYGDKDADGVIERLAGCVDGWYVAALPGARGRAAESLAEIVSRRELALCATAENPVLAWHQACEAGNRGDRVVVLGSFVTVASVAAHCL